MTFFKGCQWVALLRLRWKISFLINMKTLQQQQQHIYVYEAAQLVIALPKKKLVSGRRDYNFFTFYWHFLNFHLIRVILLSLPFIFFFWMKWKIVLGICSDLSKVHIFWEGYKILQNLHLTFVLCSGDFTKFCGLLRQHEL